MTPEQLSAGALAKANIDAATYEASILSAASSSAFKVFVGGHELTHIAPSVITSVRATLLADLQAKATTASADLAGI